MIKKRKTNNEKLLEIGETLKSTSLVPVVQSENFTTGSSNSRLAQVASGSVIVDGHVGPGNLGSSGHLKQQENLVSSFLSGVRATFRNQNQYVSTQSNSMPVTRLVNNQEKLTHHGERTSNWHLQFVPGSSK